MKKLFIKLAKILGFEIIDQNNFSSPTLNKGLDEDLSTLNKKSIVLPLGEVKITRKVKSILIIIRMNTDIEIWDQSKKRLFEQPKIEYSYRSINSLVKSINFCQNKYPNLKIKTIIVDDNSKDKNLDRIRKLIDNKNIEVIPLNHDKHKTLIKEQKTNEIQNNDVTKPVKLSRKVLADIERQKRNLEKKLKSDKLKASMSKEEWDKLEARKQKAKVRR